ncbi:MAG: DivIVA domain-containing protein [Actinobacteria bacterium]|nr:DivIVA domain-containing protein [Actinomycetota bacterium]
MALTPVEIRHVKLRKGFRGYNLSAVDRLLADIVESFEDVWRERADLADRVEQLDTDLTRHKELEELMRTTLVSAERSSHELKDQARREADLIVAEAHAEGRSVTRRAAAERERLEAELRRIKALLRSALETVEEEKNVQGEQRGGSAQAPSEVRRLVS